MLNWLIEELEALPTSIVRDSFKICGLSNELDHSEDHLLNKKINDHFGIELHLRETLLKNGGPNDDREGLLEGLKQEVHSFTFEQEDERMMIEEENESDEDFENDSIDEEEFIEKLEKIRVAPEPKRIMKEEKILEEGIVANKEDLQKEMIGKFFF